MLDGKITKMKGGSMQAPTLPLICDHWFKEAGAVVRLFKTCGSVNGFKISENYYLWDEW